jgi:hypothetical protein
MYLFHKKHKNIYLNIHLWFIIDTW